MTERRLARTHCASERRLRSRACCSWCRGLRRGGEASRVPGLPRLSADEAHTRQLLLDARLVCRHLLLVLCTSHQPSERGKIAAVRRGSAARGGISARLCGGAAWRCLIDAPASSRAAWAPNPGTLCGAAGTSCTSRLRVLRRISSSARRRSGGAGSAGRRLACADVETGCGMMLTFRRTRHVLRSCGVRESRQNEADTSMNVKGLRHMDA